MNNRFQIPYFLKATLWQYAVLLLFFFIFRILFLIVNQTEEIDGALLTQALFYGVRFDIVIAGYLSGLPFMLRFVNEFIKSKIFDTLIDRIFISLSVLSFFILSADIPYFHKFHNRITIAALNWVDSFSFMVKMIFQELSFLVYVFVFIVFAIIFIKIYFKWKPKTQFLDAYIKNIVFFIVSAGLIFLGVRGRIAGKSPIRVGTAYFSNNPFYNQLGLNPVFTFMESYFQYLNNENQAIRLMDGQEAVKNAQKLLNRITFNDDFPLAEKVQFNDSLAQKKNVVIIIVESLSADYLQYFGQKQPLTPFLDSLVYQSHFFENAYTAGTHTFNGIYSTLTGWPGLLSNHPMNTPENRRFNGLATELKKHGYHTAYFTTHDKEFDNVGGFLSNNNFDEIISQEDFPQDQVKSTLGVLDHVLFDKMTNYLTNVRQPFLAAVMTAANHKPYVLPDTSVFKSSFKAIEQQIVAYEDWAINRFFAQSKTKKWFKNTLFVIVADHGAYFPSPYELSLAYNHTPLFFYDYNIKNPQRFQKLAMQLDIPETVLSYLKLSHVNNTFGIDIFTKSRPYAYFVQDDKIGVVDDSLFLIATPQRNLQLYNYREKSAVNLVDQKPNKAKEMENYAKSMLQAAQQLISDKKTLVEP